MLAAREVERAEALLIAPGGVGVVREERERTLEPAARGRPMQRGAAVVVGGADVGARRQQRVDEVRPVVLREEDVC